jgi:hypothetical protein
MYEKCPIGTTVFNALLYCRTTQSSHELAEILGVKDIDDASTFELDRTAILHDWPLTRVELEEHPGIENDPGDLDTFQLLLVEPGWRMFYRQH